MRAVSQLRFCFSDRLVSERHFSTRAWWYVARLPYYTPVRHKGARPVREALNSAFWSALEIDPEKGNGEVLGRRENNQVIRIKEKHLPVTIAAGIIQENQLFESRVRAARSHQSLDHRQIVRPA